MSSSDLIPVNLASSVSWENFLEAIAQLLSKALTDKETESLVSGFNSFHERLRHISNHNLKRMAEEAQRDDDAKIRGSHHHDHQGKTCLLNAARGFAKAFTVAYAVKYVLALLPSIINGKILRERGVFRAAGGSDTVRFALFLGSFIGSYKGILCTMRHLRPSTLANDPTNAFVAGSIAGLSLALEKNKSRRLAIALYLSTRSVQYACAYGMKCWRLSRERRRRGLIRVHSEIVSRRPNQVEFLLTSPTGEDAPILPPPAPAYFTTPPPKHGRGRSRDFGPSAPPTADADAPTMEDRLAGWIKKWAGTAVMAFASSQILFAYICAPDSLPRSYYGFLVTHGGLRARYGALALPILNGLGEAAFRYDGASHAEIQIPSHLTSAEFISQQISPNLGAIYPPGIHHRYIGCALEHPWSNHCVSANAGTWVRAFGRGLWLYVPLNALMIIVFRWRRLVKDPKGTLLHFIKSCIRSACFLATYVTMAWAAPCFLRHVLKQEHLWHFRLNGILSGMCAVIDIPSRRLELGMYCLPRALESLWKIGVQNGLYHSVRGGEVAYFSLAMGTLMYLYQCEPDSIEDGYRGVMTRFFGKN